jgi:RNA polymerase sigma-70 factor (ECF subfamily)
MKPMGDPLEAAFTAAYEAHYAAVLRYASRRVDHNLARDVTAETFAVAWRRREELAFDEILPWLYRTAGLVTANDRRRVYRQQDLHVKLRAEIDPPPAGDHDGLNAEARLAETLDALATLSDADQQILRLHAWEELDGRALATAAGCSTTAAGVRLHHARRRLQRALRSRDQPTSADSKPTAGTIPTAWPGPTFEGSRNA